MARGGQAAPLATSPAAPAGTNQRRGVARRGDWSPPLPGAGPQEHLTTTPRPTPARTGKWARERPEGAGTRRAIGRRSRVDTESCGRVGGTHQRGRDGTRGRSYCLGNARHPLHASGGRSSARRGRCRWRREGAASPLAPALLRWLGGGAGAGGGCCCPGRWVCADGRAGGPPEESWAARAGCAAACVPRSEGNGTDRDEPAGHRRAGRSAWR